MEDAVVPDILNNNNNNDPNDGRTTPANKTRDSSSPLDPEYEENVFLQSLNNSDVMNKTPSKMTESEQMEYAMKQSMLDTGMMPSRTRMRTC